MRDPFTDPFRYPAGPNAEYQAAHESNVCSECHSTLFDGDCLNEGGCSRYKPQPEPPEEDDGCPRCQDPVPGDTHAHHQINGRWGPCHAPHCVYCAGYLP